MILFPRKGSLGYAVVDYWERWYTVEARIEGKEDRAYRIEAMDRGVVMDEFGGVRRRDLFKSEKRARAEAWRRNYRSRRER